MTLGTWITWELAKDLYNLEPSNFNFYCVDYEKCMVRIG